MPWNLPVRRLLSCLKSLGAEGQAVAVFDWLDAHGYPTRDTHVLTRIMGMLPAPRALALFDRLTGAGLAPDLACYNAALSSAGKARQWVTVVDLERRMCDAGISPDVVTFTSLIQSSRRWEDAEQRWEAMLAAGVASQAEPRDPIPHVPLHDASHELSCSTSLPEVQSGQGGPCQNMCDGSSCA